MRRVRGISQFKKTEKSLELRVGRIQGSSWDVFFKEIKLREIAYLSTL
jgi:hypothetical protein